jgi:hypothetical protein
VYPDPSLPSSYPSPFKQTVELQGVGEEVVIRQRDPRSLKKSEGKGRGGKIMKGGQCARSVEGCRQEIERECYELGRG